MNDISRDLTANSNSYAIKQQNNLKEEKHIEAEPSDSTCAYDMSCALEYMGNINKAQLSSMTKRTSDAIKAFEADPDLASSLMELEDELIDKGYPQQVAFRKADIFYKALKDARTYTD